LAELLVGLVHQHLELFLVVDVARNRHCDLAATLLVDVARNLFAGVGLAAGDHDLGAVLGHAVGDRLADALGRTGDQRHFSRKIEEVHFPSLRVIGCRWPLLAGAGLGGQIPPPSRGTFMTLISSKAMMRAAQFTVPLLALAVSACGGGPRPIFEPPPF